MTTERPVHLRVEVKRDDWQNEYVACRINRSPDGALATDDPDKVTCKRCRKSHHFPGNAVNYRGRY